MAFNQPSSFLLVSCVVILVISQVVSNPVYNDERYADAGAEGVIFGPETFEECPWVRTEEDYRMTCLSYIDESCGCTVGDQIIAQEMCVADDRTEYERLVGMQVDLEREKDEWRVRNGQLSSGEAYFRYLDCLLEVPGIMERVDEIFDSKKK